MKRKILTIISTITIALVIFVSPILATMLNSNAIKEVTQQTKTIG